MVDTLAVIAGALEIVSRGSIEALKMSPRRTTVSPTRKNSRSSATGRSELTAKEKMKKQSAKERLALDSHFYRTDSLSTAALKQPIAGANQALATSRSGGSISQALGTPA